MAKKLTDQEVCEVLQQALALCRKLDHIPTPQEFKDNNVSYHIVYRFCIKN